MSTVKHNSLKRLAVRKIHATAIRLSCPNPDCGETIDGFLSDPRGTEQECDNCGTTFMIPENVIVILS